MILNMSGGGGSYKAFIRASGDPGASVTAVLKATGKTVAAGTIGQDGTVTLKVRQGGIYTVTAVQGSQRKTDDVAVIENGEVYSVDVTFWDGTLYDGGDQYTEHTGGWAGARYDTRTMGSVDFREGDIYLHGGSKTAAAVTVNPVDVSKYNTLHAICTSSSHDWYLGISTSNADTKISGSAIQVETISAKSSRFEAVCSIPEGTGLCYPFVAMSYGSNTRNTYISKIWLESASGETRDLQTMGSLVDMIYENDLEVIG